MSQAIANLFRGPAVPPGVPVVWTPAPVLHARSVLGHYFSGHHMGHGRVFHCKPLSTGAREPLWGRQLLAHVYPFSGPNFHLP